MWMLMSTGLCSCATQNQHPIQPITLNLDKTQDDVWIDAIENLNKNQSGVHITPSDNNNQRYTLN